MGLLTKLSMKLKSYKEDYFDFEAATDKGDVKIVCKDEKYGLLDAQKRKLITQLDYNEIYEIDTDVYVAEKGGKKGVIDGKGEVILPMMYDTISMASNNLFSVGTYDSVKREFSYTLVDFNNKTVTDLTFDFPVSFHFNYAIVTKNGKWGTIYEAKMAEGIKIRPAAPIIYTDIRGKIFDGLLAVKLDKKYGYIDLEGDTIIPFKFDMASEFENGYASVSQLGKMGKIDTEGKKVVPCRYDYVEPFDENGLAAVAIDGRFGYVNKKGKEVVPCSTKARVGGCDEEFNLSILSLENAYKDQKNTINSKTGKSKLEKEYNKEIKLMYQARETYLAYIKKVEQKQAEIEKFRSDYVEAIVSKNKGKTTEAEVKSEEETTAETVVEPVEEAKTETTEIVIPEFNPAEELVNPDEEDVQEVPADELKTND